MAQIGTGIGIAVSNLIPALMNGGSEPSGPQWPSPLYSGMSLIGFLIDFFRIQGKNKEAQALQDMFTESLGGYQEQVLASGQNLPAFAYGGETYGQRPGRFVPSVQYGEFPTQAPLGHAPGTSEMRYAEAPEGQYWTGRYMTGPPGSELDPVFDTVVGGQRGLGQFLPSDQPTINIDELFGGPGDMLDFWRKYAPTREELTVPLIDIDTSEMEAGIARTRTDVMDILGGGLERVTDPMSGIIAMARERLGGIFEQAQVGDLLEGIEMPETDLSEVLSAQLAGIGEAGKKKEQLAQQSLAALAPRYGGLENLRREQVSLTSEMGAERGTLAQEARGRVRGEELAAQEFVANLQKQAASESASINAALSQALMGTEVGFAGTLAGAESSFAGAKASSLLGLEGIGVDLASRVTLAEEMENARIQRENIQESIWNPFTEEMQLVGGAADAETSQALLLLGQLTGMDEAELERIMAAAGIDLSTFATLMGGGAMDQMFPTFSSFIEGIGPR